MVYAASAGEKLTFATGPGPDLRRHFEKHKSLPNKLDDDFRQIKVNKPAFAYSIDLGAVDASGSESLRLSIGRYRSPAISWTATKDIPPDRDLFYFSDHKSLYESVSKILLWSPTVC